MGGFSQCPAPGTFVKIAKPHGDDVRGPGVSLRQMILGPSREWYELWETHGHFIWEVYKVRDAARPRVVTLRRSVRNGRKFKRMDVNWRWLKPAAPLEVLAAQADWPTRARY